MKFTIEIALLLLGQVCLMCTLNTSAQENSTDQGVYTTSVSNSTSSESEAEIQAAAKRWGISELDYIRYTEIIKGPLGRWNPTIDPVLALGIYAESESEKQRYAELYAKQEYELTSRTLEFEQAYRAAFNRLYPESSIVDRSLLQPYYDYQQRKERKFKLSNSLSPPRLKPGDRILYFPEVDCQSCGQQLRYIVGLLKSVENTGVDIYVVNATTTEQVRHWAKTHSIDPIWVNERQVTLNLDQGLSNRLAKQLNGRNSLLYLSRDNTVFSLELSQIGL